MPTFSLCHHKRKSIILCDELYLIVEFLVPKLLHLEIVPSDVCVGVCMCDLYNLYNACVYVCVSSRSYCNKIPKCRK